MGVFLLASQFNNIWQKIVDAISSVLVPLGLVWLLSLVMFPLIKMLERRGVGPRGLSVGVVFASTIAIFILIIYFLIPFALDQVRLFFENDWPTMQAYVQTDLRNDFIFGEEIYDWLVDTINNSTIVQDTVSSIVDGITSSISNQLINIVSIVVVLPVTLIYYLKDYEMINDTIRSIIPKRYEKNTSELGSRLNNTVGAYIRGQLFLMLAIGAAATAAYWGVGLPYFFVFGILVGLTNIIPYFGAIIAMIPVVIYTIITGDASPSPIIIIGVNVLLQTLEGNIFQPIIMGRQLEMHAIVIIMSILFFGTLFGTFGVIFAAPMAATIRVVVEFYREKRKEREESALISGT
jgi:putative permease